MTRALTQPLRPVPLLLVSLALVAAVTLYCLSYTALAGEAESPLEGIVWAIVNILPWLAAFEAAKRFGSPAGKAAILVAALFVSLALGFAAGAGGGLGFELVRRLPGLLVVALLLAVAARRVHAEARADSASSEELPLTPGQLDWISAAGNYVELHGCGRTLIHRVPLSRLEAQLSDHGFVRVHRSTLVRRDRIARVRPLDVILLDGTSLRTGKRYRSALRS
jgi:hypothetical protein